MSTIDDKFNPVSIHKINQPLVDYFNRMQISYYSDCTVSSFYKKRDNYSDFMFWKEIKSVINKIVFDLGVDDNLKGDFNEQDKDQLQEADNWKGRVWKRNEITIDIFYNDEPFGLTLRLKLNKND